MRTLKICSMALVVGLALLTGRPPQAAENPFAQFTGSWSGSGSITVQDGTRERIRCRGRYVAGQGGQTLQLELRCASDSYKFELQSDITYDGGNVTGTWNETTRQVFGSLSGRSTNSHIQAVAHSVGFTANLSLSTRGNRQSVSIKSPGSDISEVAVSLARSGR
jgi:hypothetical protein